MRCGQDEGACERSVIEDKTVKKWVLRIFVIVIEKSEIIEYNKSQETWGARYSCNFEPTKL